MTAAAESAEQVNAPEYVRAETARLDVLRARIAEFVGTDCADFNVVLGRSVSELMSVIASGLPQQGGRNKILLVGPIHPSVTLAWGAAAKAHCLELAAIELNEDAEINRERFGRAIDDRCLAVVATHVDHLHGFELPIAEVTKYARHVGAYSIIDGAQAVGRVPIDMISMDADAYLGSGRKALLAPLGTAFMIARIGFVETIKPTVWSTRSAHLGTDNEILTAAGPVRLEGNLPDLAALAGLQASIKLMTADCVQALMTHVDRLVPQLIGAFEAVGFVPFCLPATIRNTGIISFRLRPGLSGTDLQRHLAERELVIAAAPDSVRVSLHFSNGGQDITRLAEEVRRHAG